MVNTSLDWGLTRNVYKCFMLNLGYLQQNLNFGYLLLWVYSVVNHTQLHLEPKDQTNNVNYL